MSTFVLHGHAVSPSRRIDYAKELNQEQLDVVLHGDGPCLVLAGAGSGKTRTLTYRVSHLLEQGVDPSSILLLTFTNKAAKEMLARVGGLLGAEAKAIWGGTFHSVAARILRSTAGQLGYAPNFSILDAEDAVDLVKAIMKDLSIDPKARRFPSASVVQDILSYSRNVQCRIDETLEFKYPNFQQFSGDLEEIGRQYQARKKSANAMDFDDLLTNMARVLEDSALGEAISGRFRYVLVDEYQDTNAVQARMVRGYARVHRNVVVVGDDAQSIYAFRGADVKNILSFPEQWPGAKIFKLVTNYRSTPEILELANESLTHNRARFDKELVAVRGKGEKPRLVPAASAAQEAQFTAEQILALRAEGTALRNMAVLFRSGAHSQALEFECLKRDIPYEYRGGKKFFERAHIKDVVAFLRIRENPLDEVAWLRTLGLQAGIGAATASQIVDAWRASTAGKSPEEIVLEKAIASDAGSLLPARAKGGWETFVATVEDMLARGDRPSLMIRAILESPYQEYLEREYPDWRDRLEDLEQLALFAEGYETVSPFLADIALYDDVVAGRQGETRADDERIVLSTIHQAKGLEWDTVFIIHLSDNAFPSRRALAEQGGLEEERRLFYVAVTRARHRLFLTYPMTLGYDTLVFNQPSTFLGEVSPRLFERVELRESHAPRSAFRVPHADEWSWDDGESDDGAVVELDRNGERRRSAAPGTTVWKSSAPQTKKQPGSFLRDIGEL